MTDIILDNMYLILLLPLWICLIIMSARFFAVFVNKFVIYALTLLSSLSGIILCSISLLKIPSTIEQSFPFIKIGNFSLNFGLHVDKLSLITALVLFLISFAVQIFSISYMKNEPKEYRFYAYLNMFNFSMAGLIFSPNLYQMYFFWELIGIMSYLMIGFEYNNPIKSDASKRVFLMNRVGDTALLSGILFSSYLMYNYAGNYSFVTLSFEDMNAITTLISAYTSTPLFYLICILFIIGAAVKSAQFPFYTWLQDAMEAKLPVSALLHSATLVAAGAYLLLRILPLFTLESNVMLIISWLGIITALICSILASIETHPKKILAYSTSANFGLIFFAIGLGNIKAALIFLIAHAFIKSMLFLTLDENENYINCITFLIGALSLSGLLFSGMVAKEFLFGSIDSTIFSIIYCICAFLTAFYIMRLPLLIMKNLVKKIDIFKYIPICLLLILNIVFYFYIRKQVAFEIAEPFWAALAGWGVVYFLYVKNLLTKFDETPKLLEKVYNNTFAKIYDDFSKCMNFIEINIFSNYKPLIMISRLGVKSVNWIELNVMNRTVTLTAEGIRKLSEFGAKLQTKNVQNYNAYAFMLVTLAICLVIITYTMLISQVS